jgi:dolichyl-phosphate beta-glucosyltransferase
MHGLHLLVKILILGPHQEIRDTQCGFKLFKKEVGKKLFSNLHVRRWAFDLELVVLSNILKGPQGEKLAVKEVPIAWHEVDGSKLNLVTATLNMLYDMARIRFYYMVGVWKAV